MFCVFMRCRNSTIEMNITLNKCLRVGSFIDDSHFKPNEYLSKAFFEINVNLARLRIIESFKIAIIY